MSEQIMRLLVGTADGLYELPDGKAVAFLGSSVTGLAAGEGGLWALIEGRELHSSTDGRSWLEGARVEGRAGTCLAWTASGLFVGTAEAHLLRLDGSYLVPVPSFESIEGRGDWYTPWGGPPGTRSIAAGRDGAIYVNVHVGGVVRSRDGGDSWSPTLDIHADVHQVFVHPQRPAAVLAASARGLGVSDDGGDRWRFLTTGLHAPYMRAVTVAEGVILASASTGPSGGQAAVYRLSAAGEFERCRQGLPEWFDGNIDTGCLVGRGREVAFGAAGGEVYHSDDGGEIWRPTARTLPAITCLLAL